MPAAVYQSQSEHGPADTVLEEKWVDFQVKPIAFYESGDTVFIHVRMTAEGLDTESMHMATIKDGKFATFQAFENSALMMAAAKK